MAKIIIHLSSNTHFICSSEMYFTNHYAGCCTLLRSDGLGSEVITSDMHSPEDWVVT